MNRNPKGGGDEGGYVVWREGWEGCVRKDGVGEGSTELEKGGAGVDVRGRE